MSQPISGPAKSAAPAPQDLIRITQAFDFVARVHVDQRRKGERAEPYINHLAEVAHLVAEATGGADANLIIAALLHDAIEDVGVMFPDTRPQALLDKLVITAVSALAHQHWRPPALWGHDRDAWKLPDGLRSE